jgi:hypothetical protein
MVIGEDMTKKEKAKDSYPSLFDAFCLGDRVKRTYKGNKGKPQEYKGTILAIDKEFIEVYWDTLNGKFRPSGMDVTFTECPLYEIFNGNEYYSPIKKDVQ